MTDAEISRCTQVVISNGLARKSEKPWSSKEKRKEEKKDGVLPHGGGRRRKPREAAYEAKTVPGRRQIKNRPTAARKVKAPAHYEMDTVVSGRGGRGELLVMPTGAAGATPSNAWDTSPRTRSSGPSGG